MTVSERELSGPPSTLPLLLKAAAPMIPGASRLPFVAGGGGAMPSEQLLLSDVEIDRDHLAAYGEVCGFTLRGALPVTYPHVLAFPLHLALMTSGGFPFPAIGLVHIANRIEQLRAIDAGERLSLRVSATEPEPHPRGMSFAILTEARVGEELVWRGTSTNLRRGRGGSERAERTENAGPLPATVQWRLGGDLGRRYAGVSGDRNPIHMSGPSAKLFGFPRAIAHGMWTKARCLAALESRLPDDYAVEVSFRKPILLPSTVGFGHEGDRFTVRNPGSDAIHLNGTIKTGVDQ